MLFELNFMTPYQTIAVCIALLALIISAVSLRRTSKTTKEQLSLQRVMADLAQKQLEQIQDSENSAESARLSLRVDTAGSSTRNLVLTNVGEAEARDVEFELDPQGDLESPLVHSDYEEKFPIPVLTPGNSVSTLMAIHLGTATAFRVILKWRDRVGNHHSEETYVSL